MVNKPDMIMYVCLCVVCVCVHIMMLQLQDIFCLLLHGYLLFKQNHSPYLKGIRQIIYSRVNYW